MVYSGESPARGTNFPRGESVRTGNGFRVITGTQVSMWSVHAHSCPGATDVSNMCIAILRGELARTVWPMVNQLRAGDAETAVYCRTPEYTLQHAVFHATPLSICTVSALP